MKNHRDLYKRNGLIVTIQSKRADFWRNKLKKQSLAFDFKRQINVEENTPKATKIINRLKLKTKPIYNKKKTRVAANNSEKPRPFVVGVVRHKLHSPPFLHAPVVECVENKYPTNTAQSFAPKHYKFQPPQGLKRIFDINPFKETKSPFLPKTLSNKKPCSKKALGLTNVTVRTNCQKLTKDSPLIDVINMKKGNVKKNNTVAAKKELFPTDPVNLEEEEPVFGNFNLKKLKQNLQDQYCKGDYNKENVDPKVLALNFESSSLIKSIGTNKIGVRSILGEIIDTPSKNKTPLSSVDQTITCFSSSKKVVKKLVFQNEKDKLLKKSRSLSLILDTLVQKENQTVSKASSETNKNESINQETSENKSSNAKSILSEQENNENSESFSLVLEDEEFKSRYNDVLEELTNQMGLSTEPFSNEVNNQDTNVNNETPPSLSDTLIIDTLSPVISEDFSFTSPVTNNDKDDLICEEKKSSSLSNYNNTLVCCHDSNDFSLEENTLSKIFDSSICEYENQVTKPIEDETRAESKETETQNVADDKNESIVDSSPCENQAISSITIPLEITSSEKTEVEKETLLLSSNLEATTENEDESVCQKEIENQIVNDSLPCEDQIFTSNIETTPSKETGNNRESLILIFDSSSMNNNEDSSVTNIKTEKNLEVIDVTDSPLVHSNKAQKFSSLYKSSFLLRHPKVCLSTERLADESSVIINDEDTCVSSMKVEKTSPNQKQEKVSSVHKEDLVELVSDDEGTEDYRKYLSQVLARHGLPKFGSPKSTSPQRTPLKTIENVAAFYESPIRVRGLPKITIDNEEKSNSSSKKNTDKIIATPIANKNISLNPVVKIPKIIIHDKQPVKNDDSNENGVTTPSSSNKKIIADKTSSNAESPVRVLSLRNRKINVTPSPLKTPRRLNKESKEETVTPKVSEESMKTTVVNAKQLVSIQKENLSENSPTRVLSLRTRNVSVTPSPSKKTPRIKKC